MSAMGKNQTLPTRGIPGSSNPPLPTHGLPPSQTPHTTDNPTMPTGGDPRFKIHANQPTSKFGGFHSPHENIVPRGGFMLDYYKHNYLLPKNTIGGNDPLPAAKSTYDATPRAGTGKPKIYARENIPDVSSNTYAQRCETIAFGEATTSAATQGEDPHCLWRPGQTHKPVSH